jgi:hypothetical protein
MAAAGWLPSDAAAPVRWSRALGGRHQVRPGCAARTPPGAEARARSGGQRGHRAAPHPAGCETRRTLTGLVPQSVSKTFGSRSHSVIYSSPRSQPGGACSCWRANGWRSWDRRHPGRRPAPAVSRSAHCLAEEGFAPVPQAWRGAGLADHEHLKQPGGGIGPRIRNRPYLQRTGSPLWSARTDRRTFLKGAGLAGAASLAGWAGVPDARRVWRRPGPVMPGRAER